MLIPRKESNAMKKAIIPLTALPPTGMGAVDKAWDAVSVSQPLLRKKWIGKHWADADALHCASDV